MRACGGPIALAIALLAAAAPARAAVPGRIDVRAESIGLYPFNDGSTLLAAEGRVIVRIGTRSISADGVRYDLRKNTLLAAGNVTVTGQGTAFTAAAYTLDLVTNGATLLRLEPAPTTFVLSGEDGAVPVESPADESTFAAIDLGRSKPYLRSKHASIIPGANVRLTPAYVPTGPGPELVTPSYLYTFSATNFSQSALPGVTFDQPYPLFGTANSLAAGHLRYDGQNGPDIGFDEHLVRGNTAYAVASILPFRGRRIDLNAFQQLRRGLTQTLGGFYQYGPARNSFATYQMQWTTPVARTTFSSSQFNASNKFDLVASTLDHFVAPLFTYRLQAGYGYDHTPGAAPFVNAFRIGAGGYIASPNVRVPFGIDASARYDYSWTGYDYPHQVTSGTLTFTTSRRINRSLSLLGTAAFQEYANRYRTNAAQYLGLPDPSQPYYAPDGTPYPGFFAYAGLNTYRTYALQTTWRPRGGENSVQLFLTKTQDFPQSHGYGRPPLFATLALTQRLGSTLRVDIARSYAFGWNGQHVVPQYSLSISP